jgi:hypothetical protein
VYIEPENMELDAPRWTPESFTEALEGLSLNAEEWGDPVEALFKGFSSELAWDEGGRVIEDEWLTIASFQTESGDSFIIHRPGRMSRRDLAAELFLEDPEYYKSPGEFYFTELKYYHFKPGAEPQG